jgi:glycosyltransferase involved in cell wall biosynthesis
MDSVADGESMNACMLAYAHYINDARIKSYVRILEGQGHRVDVIALRSHGESPLEARQRGTIYRIMEKYQGQSMVMYFWSYLKFFLKSAFLLTRLSFRHRYDVIHVHNMPNALVFAAIIPKILGTKLMLDVHDLMTVNYMAKFEAGENSLPVKILKLEQRISAALADHVFCADDNQQNYLGQHCGVPAKKVTVMMNLPNVDLFKPIKKIKKGRIFRIVYHGTIAHRLGIDLIIRAMAKVVEKIPAELWIYGAGDFLPQALALTSELGLDEKIHFSKSFFPVEQISEFVCGMDLGIIGNRHNIACDRYMLPVKLLEYVYLGVPVVAPRLEVITHYFDDTMVRFYEPENVAQMANWITELFYHPEEREILAKRASTFYRRHNIRAQADCYLALVATPKISFHPIRERDA